MAEGLKACPNPWCTSAATPIPLRRTPAPNWYVACGCGVQTFNCNTEAEAITAWNRRPEPSRQDKAEDDFDPIVHARAFWAQASRVSGYFIQEGVADPDFVNVCNGDLRKLDELVHSWPHDPQPTLVWRPDREAVARIIDPDAWAYFDVPQEQRHDQEALSRFDAWKSSSLAKADAILALPASPSTDQIETKEELGVASASPPQPGTTCAPSRPRGSNVCSECGEPRAPYCRCDESWFFDMDGKP